MTHGSYVQFVIRKKATWISHVKVNHEPGNVENDYYNLPRSRSGEYHSFLTGQRVKKCPKHIICSCNAFAELSEVNKLLDQAERALKMARANFADTLGESDWGHETLNAITDALDCILKYKIK